MNIDDLKEHPEFCMPNIQLNMFARPEPRQYEPQLRNTAAIKNCQWEWYTPPQLIDAARNVLGRIDLDPASSIQANRTVLAEIIYTMADDGLHQDWPSGSRVWCNPPFAASEQRPFIERCVAHDGPTLTLTPATASRTTELILSSAQSICWIRSIKGWYGPHATSDLLPMPQMIMVGGWRINAAAFATHFGHLGVIR